MTGLFRDRRALDQVVGQLLVLMVSLSALSFALVVISPLIAQYESRNRINEAEAIMTSLHNEIVKVQEEPAGSRRSIEIEIKRGGIELLNDPPRMVYYVQVQKKVVADVTGMEFAYTARGAMFRLNLTLPFISKAFIGPGSNVIYISKTGDSRINVTAQAYV